MLGREADAKRLVGSTFAGKYRVLQHLRSGGIADVYLAEQLTLRPVSAGGPDVARTTPASFPNAARFGGSDPVEGARNVQAQPPVEGARNVQPQPAVEGARNVQAQPPVEGARIVQPQPSMEGARIGSAPRLALKVLRQEFQDDLSIVRRFERGALAAAQISHPNVALAGPLSRLPNGLPYCTLELLVGLDLADTLAYAGALSEGRALRIAEGAAAGLAAAHQAGVMHLDVKPENIFLVHQADGREFVKLLDFGGAAMPNEKGRHTVDAVCSTPEYMAPEQVRGAEATPAMDVFALGVVLFEMLVGFPPPRERSPRDIRSALARPVYRSETRLRPPDISPLVRGAMERALAFDPKQRFSQMAEFHAALLGALEQRPSVRPMMAK